VKARTALTVAGVACGVAGELAAGQEEQGHPADVIANPHRLAPARGAVVADPTWRSRA
jgi:hypothetical protein